MGLYQRTVRLVCQGLLLLASLFNISAALAAVPYAIGNPTLTELWVDPLYGSDGNSGLTRSAPLRTLTAAWAQTPSAATFSTTGYRINLLPGSYPCEPGPEQDNCQNYFSDRRGTPDFPLIIRAVDGPGTVTLRGGLNLAGLSYFYLQDVTLAGGAALPTNSSGNNLLHFEGSDHVLLRGVTLTGPACDNDSCNNLQEVLKVNQTQYLYVEDSVIGGAWHSAVDYFVVQFGHFINNRVHTAGQWGMYVKGGSAYLLIEGNEFHASQLGFQAGQSANFAMMRSPWLHHEAYDIKFVNNLLHDIAGVGVSVAGGYNILVAHNTLYRVATSTNPGYPLMSFVHGERNCTPTDEQPAPVPVCQANAAAGGWGPVAENTGEAVIPSRNVLVFNNLFYNPAPLQTLYTHFGFEGPASPGGTFQNLPADGHADSGLSIRGNVIWNGPVTLPTGAGDAGACLDANPLCNNAQLLADNAINTLEPALTNPTQGNFVPVAGGNIAQRAGLAIPDFTWVAAPGRPAVPTGNLSNRVTTDRSGAVRNTSVPTAGAYASVTASNNFTGQRANYRIVRNGSNFDVMDQVAGGAVVTLTGADSIRFADQTVNLRIGDLSKTIAPADLKTLIELYVAFFNRVPEADGLAYWISQFKAGVTLDQIADSFYAAAIGYSSLTGYSAGMSDAEFVGKIYANVLGRTGLNAPPAEDVLYWVNQFTGSKGQLVATMLWSAHTFSGDPTWGWVPQLLDNKVSAATLFTIAQGLNYNTPEASISHGMAIAAAVTRDGIDDAVRLMNLTDTAFDLSLP